MPRVKSSPTKYCKVEQQTAAKTWLLLSQNEILESSANSDSTPDIVKLRHPRTSQETSFLFGSDNKKIQEVVTFSDTKRSWFIDDTVRENGKLYLSTPIDPLFIVLPYLKSSFDNGKVVPLADLLVDETFPETKRLLSCCSEKQLNLIADQKGDGELNAWKFNEEKTLSWLQRKVEKVSKVLKEKNISVGVGAHSNTFVKSEKENGEDTAGSDAYLSYACGLVSEYLSTDLSQKLSSSLGLPEESKPDITLKRKSTTPKLNQSKKAKQEPQQEEEIEPKIEEKAVTKISNKEKARAKSAVGSKNITDFFKSK